MKSFFFLIISALIVVGCNKKMLYISMDDLSPETVKTLKKNDYKFAMTLNGGNFISKGNNIEVDSVKMVKGIEEVFPIAQPYTLGILDWEQGFPILFNPETKPLELNRVIKEYIRAIRIAKQQRPNIKWGIYALPATRYWNRDSSWYNHLYVLDALLKEVDIFCPSVYGYYPNEDSANYNYVKDNIQFSLKLAEKYKKPVYPFVWHRWHDSNPSEGLKLMPWHDLSIFIEALSQTKVNNKGIDGLIWWGADRYYYKEKYKNISTEIPKNESFTHYHNSLIVDYGKKIKQKLRQKTP